MRKFGLIMGLCAIMAGFSGCLKVQSGCEDRLPANELTIMQTYAANIGMNATVDPSGLLYEITNPGSGVMPTESSRIYVTYTGKLVSDGTVFDAVTDASTTGFYLQQMIAGWRIALPKLQKGGSMRIIVPSSLAYGCAGYSIIPADAILYFDITLVDVQ